MFITM